MTDSTAILVLGMHRTGTSATAGWLQTLGVNLGPYLMAEDPTQPKGYFEHAEIVGIHDEVMAAFGSSWDDPRALPEGWEHDRRVRLFRARLMEIIRRDLMTQPLWCAKDPRLCRLLPMWLGMLGELGVPVRAICVLRHPAEVAESLALRNGFSADKSGLLWLRYILEAERHSRRMSRVTMRYSDLLRDWRAESQRIAQAFGIVWPKPPDEAAAAVTDFLESGLRHHESVYFDRFPPPLRRWIVTAYRALASGCGPSGHGRAILDSLQRELAPYDSYVAACWLERVRDVELQNEQVRANSQLVQSALAQSQSELALAQSDLAANRTELERKIGALAKADIQLVQTRSELAMARAELAQEIAATKAELTHTQAELTDVRTASMQVSAQLTQARMELVQACGELERTRADSKSAHQELEAVYRSRYWRFIRPWRALDTYLRNRRWRRRQRSQPSK